MVSVVLGPTCTSTEPYSLRSEPAVSSSSRAQDPVILSVALGVVIVIAAIRTEAIAAPEDYIPEDPGPPP